MISAVPDDRHIRLIHPHGDGWHGCIHLHDAPLQAMLVHRLGHKHHIGLMVLSVLIRSSCPGVVPVELRVVDVARVLLGGA